MLLCRSCRLPAAWLSTQRCSQSAAPDALTPRLHVCSEHNRLMRFVKAQPEWLPEGHKCANVCIPCGHTGYPACPLEPRCSRRRSLEDTTQFLDGPTGIKVGPASPTA